MGLLKNCAADPAGFNRVFCPNSDCSVPAATRKPIACYEESVKNWLTSIHKREGLSGKTPMSQAFVNVDKAR